MNRAFDLVLVHGDPNFAALGDTFALANQIADRITYTGLVCPPAPSEPDERFDVLVSAGGGAAGEQMITAAVGAARLLPDLPNWCIITGPNLPQADYDALRDNLPSNVTLTRFRPDLASLMRGAALSVSQAGYNTVADILMAGCHALLLPFAADGETEQTDRAERLAAIGRISTLAESALTPASLAAAIRQEIARPLPPQSLQIRVDGAVRSTEILFALAEERARSRA